MANRIIKGFLSILGGRAVTLLVGAATTPILARLLGSAGYGDYGYVMSALGLITTMVGMGGLSSSIRKFIVEDRDIADWTAQTFGFFVRVGMLLAVSAGVAVAIFASSELSGEYLGEKFSIYLFVLAFLIVLEQLFSILRSTLMAFSLEQYSEFFQASKKPVFALVAILLVSLGWGVVGALAGQIVGSAIAAVGCLYYLRGELSFKSVMRPTSKSFPRRELLTFNFGSIIFLFSLTSLYHIDILMLNPLVGSEQTGYYKAALTVAEFLWFVPYAAQLVLVHSMSKLWSREEYDAISATAAKVTRYTLLFTLLLIVGLSALAEPFVLVYYGQEFAPAVGPLLLLLPGALGFAVARPILATSHGSGKIRILIYATGSTAVLNAILNAVLIPRYGVHGAAVATSVGYGTMLIAHVWSARKIGFDPFAGLHLGRILLTGTVAAAVIFPLSRFFHSQLVALFVVPPVGFVVFLAAAITFGAVPEEDLDRATTTLSQSMRQLSTFR